ncbi:hypothetical protein LMH87_005836 [Akanthomyces muscarius]|uniref:Uncharacterized protein n=1 Tax=Akanthomyces muscarius TaxID=2231603 RepID=A0A9W8QP41_AKAMU|nr:hypothetical protein LMH87_005836 [Akanthomyces muscarius]KAJ4164151.1 hypothetical protein LMH87_005836 [Akanthomyces muscarius]
MWRVTCDEPISLASGTIEASSSSESAAISATSQASSTRGSSIELPGLAAASPPSSSKPIDVEAAPPTAPSSSVSSTSSPANEAADAPASTTTANQDGNTSAPPAATSSTTQLASSSPEPPGQSTTLPSAIVNPGASDSTVLSSSPSTLMTDISSTSTSIAMATSMSFSVTDPSDTAGSGTNSVGSPSGGATPTPTSRRAGDIELQTNDGPSGPPTGMIIGGAVGGAAALAMIALLFWLWRRRSNKKRQLGQPRTPLSERPGGGSQLSGGAAATAGPFAAGRPASTRAKNPLQGWWAAHGVGNNAPLITPEYGEKQAATVQPVPARARRASLGQRALQNPFSDAHSTEVRIAAAITPQQQQQQQQRLRGILKQPMPTLHSSHPSDASSVVAAAAGAARRSRAHSASGQRASQRMLASRRTSSLTNDPFEERRTKFRSDPFDLELDTRMLSSSSFSSSAIPQKDPRASSVYSANTGTSSRYTSGLSSTWGAEPAVAVAPLVVGGGGRSGVSDSPTLPQEPSRGGGFGGGIVGQAM